MGLALTKTPDVLLRRVYGDVLSMRAAFIQDAQSSRLDLTFGEPNFTVRSIGEKEGLRQAIRESTMVPFDSFLEAGTDNSHGPFNGGLRIILQTLPPEFHDPEAHFLPFGFDGARVNALPSRGRHRASGSFPAAHAPSDPQEMLPQ